MAKNEPPEKELLPADTKPVWIAITEEPRFQGHLPVHRLLYGRKRIMKGTTPADLSRFRDLADHCNKRGLTPGKRGPQCKADRTLPAPPKRRPAEAPADESDACDVEPIHGKVVSFPTSDA